MQTLIKYIQDINSIIYPQYCVACQSVLYDNEWKVCLRCLYHLPKTKFHLDPENAVVQKFWGKVIVENATAHYFFQKSLRMQKILHHIKYKGEYQLGTLLGKIAGNELIGTDFARVDYILAIPLHEKKLKERGYNQSEAIAKGLSVSLNVPHVENGLVRMINNQTQTRKNRFERWVNTNDIFAISPDNTIDFSGKHVLLVDDVITTGSTFESCVEAIKLAYNCKVSIFALSFAS